MKLSDRIDNYKEAFSKYTFELGLSWRIFGIWQIGFYYKRKYGYYGEYPPSFLNRVVSLFPDVNNVLHLFSGKVDTGLWENEVTFDINPKLNPDVVGDAKELSKYFDSNQFDLVIADPPYGENYKKYGTKKINKRIVMHELFKILKSKGKVCWLDTMIPIYTNEEWKMIGLITIVTGTNRVVRLLSIFQVV